MAKKKWTRFWIVLIVLVVGGIGGYFNYYFRSFHLRLPGFTYVGRQTYNCEGKVQRIFEYRHKTGMEFVLIPGGTFHWEGKDLNFKPFLMSKTKVTQKNWKKMMGTEPWTAKGLVIQEGYPAVGVTWKEAMAFCEKTHLELPDEGRWEYACRGGRQSIYFWGDTLDKASRYTWYNQKAPSLSPVGGKGPNGYGLLDMVDNGREWCRDSYRPSVEEINRKERGAFDSHKVVRASGLPGKASLLRSDHRQGVAARTRAEDLTFRCIWRPELLMEKKQKK